IWRASPWRRGPSTASPSSRVSSQPLGSVKRRSQLQPEPPEEYFADAVLRRSSRRGFLEWAGAALIGLAGARTVAQLVLPDDAGAYTNFCGHTYTTGNCPRPTGLPRVDRNDYPLRASDG